MHMYSTWKSNCEPSCNQNSRSKFTRSCPTFPSELSNVLIFSSVLSQVLIARIKDFVITLVHELHVFQAFAINSLQPTATTTTMCANPKPQSRQLHMCVEPAKVTFLAGQSLTRCAQQPAVSTSANLKYAFALKQDPPA